MVGRLLALFRLPGFVRETEYRDPESDQVVLKIRTSPRYTIIETDAREFYFLRESGKFDGIGAMSLNDPLPMNGLQADRIRRGNGMT